MAKEIQQKSSLKEKLLKNTTSKLTATIIESEVFNKGKDKCPTDVPIINLALRSKIDEGISAGITMLAAPSKHFKTGFTMLLASAFIKKYPDGIILFYDSEFGSRLERFVEMGIPPEQVIHTPITNIEELKLDIVQQLENIEVSDNVFIMIDSIGNLASKKEVDDAKDGKSVADLSRAKAIKSLFRIITPQLNLKNIPLVVINHGYQTIEFISKYKVGGGDGAYLMSDDIWTITRAKEKEKDGGVAGYWFTIKIEKSRDVKEESKFPVYVDHRDGIAKWSGLEELAIEGKFVVKSSAGKNGSKYNIVDQETGELGEDYFNIEFEDRFWEKMLKNEAFINFMETKYKL